MTVTLGWTTTVVPPLPLPWGGWKPWWAIDRFGPVARSDRPLTATAKRRNFFMTVAPFYFFFCMNGSSPDLVPDTRRTVTSPMSGWIAPSTVRLTERQVYWSGAVGVMMWVAEV